MQAERDVMDTLSCFVPLSLVDRRVRLLTGDKEGWGTVEPNPLQALSS